MNSVFRLVEPFHFSSICEQESKRKRCRIQRVEYVFTYSCDAATSIWIAYSAWLNPSTSRPPVNRNRIEEEVWIRAVNYKLKPQSVFHEQLTNRIRGMRKILQDSIQISPVLWIHLPWTCTYPCPIEGLTRRNTVFIFLWLRHRNTWTSI